eukprot:4285348-Amphidinium_carterae.1
MDEGCGCGTVRIELPASKTDHLALGKCRSHGCSCPSGLCPVAAVRKLMARAPEAPEVPLWPDESGNFVAKTAVIDTVRALASLACPGTDTTGMTGH